MPECDRQKRPCYRLQQSLPSASLCFSQNALYLGDSLLDGIQVRRVGRQVQQLAARALDQFPYPISLMGAQRLSITTTCPSRRDGQQSFDRGDAHGLARHALQKATSIGDGGRSRFLEVLFE